MITRRCLLTAGGLLLAGCSSVPRRSEPLTTLRFNGRFSVQLVHAQQRENVSGKYLLVRSPESLRFDLLTPLSGVLARVDVTAQGAVLQRPNKPDVQAASARELMLETFGFALPLSLLSHWLQGQPDTGAPFERVSADAFEQSDWQVTVLRRDSLGRAQLLRLERAGSALAPAITLTLSVNA